ncbi:MAG: tryptophan synthase alpha chain [Cyclobacteriaceae bacterium]|nr:MAG: tryptophan synthase alpha chain [Cyclobacteriaceae bacterium]
MNRIDKLFQRREKNILSVFYTAGFPGLNDTVTIARHLEAAGADMIEIGIPFSDPIADGPVIQRSNNRAIANGMTLKLLLDQVKQIRQTVTMPLLLMGYLNPVLQYGVEKFFTDAAEAGADGLILPDLPPEEFELKYRKKAMQAGIHVVFLVTPSSADERIRLLDSLSGGFLYAVSLSGVTGTRTSFTTEQDEFLKRLQKLKLKNPVLAGFGISNSESFHAACRLANGAIVGSAFISLLENSHNLQAQIEGFIHNLRSLPVPEGK